MKLGKKKEITQRDTSNQQMVASQESDAKTINPDSDSDQKEGGGTTRVEIYPSQVMDLESKIDSRAQDRT